MQRSHGNDQQKLREREKVTDTFMTKMVKVEKKVTSCLLSWSQNE